MLKLYIAIHEDVPDHMVPILVAHTMINAHMAWHNRHGEGLTGKYNEWLRDSFRKCVVKANDKEFQKIAQLDRVFGGYDNTVLGVKLVALLRVPGKKYLMYLNLLNYGNQNEFRTKSMYR